MSYTEAELKTMMTGYPERYSKPKPIDKKARRKKTKAQKQARKKNR